MGQTTTGDPLNLVTNDTTPGSKPSIAYAANLASINAAIQANLDADTAETAARAAADTAAISTAQAYTDAALKGLAVKDPIRAVATSNVTLAAPGNTFDTVVFTASGVDDVLLAGQTDATQNGLYVWNGASAALTRRSDAATSVQMKPGLSVFVSAGSAANADKIWELQTDGPIVLGTTQLTFGVASGSTAPPLGSPNNPVTNASATRPTGLPVVYWTCATQPTNAIAGDIWTNNS